jgi:flavodoxin
MTVNNPGTERKTTMSKKLIAYFSATGRTAKVAKLLAEVLGADLHEIKPKEPYTRADLNWMNRKSRSSVEMKNKAFRPEIAGSNVLVEDYDVIFLGFPIWWYVAPTIVNTFLESADFSGKKIILFATSGSSKFGHTAEELKISVSEDTKIIEGKLLNGRQTAATVKAWTDTLESV